LGWKEANNNFSELIPSIIPIPSDYLGLKKIPKNWCKKEGEKKGGNKNKDKKKRASGTRVAMVKKPKV